MRFINFLTALIILFPASGFAQQPLAPEIKYETTYDAVKKQTTVKLLPVKLYGENGNYHSLQMSPSFKYPGEVSAKPEIVDFELQIVVKSRLRTDLYVVFVIDGEKIFLSSNRWAVMRPVPGRVWMGERLVFRMPYETLLRLAGAKKLEIRMGAVIFPISAAHIEVIRDFADKIKAIPKIGRSKASPWSAPLCRPFGWSRPGATCS